MALAFFAIALRALRAFVVPRTRFELGSPFVIVLQKYPIYSQRFSLFYFPLIKIITWFYPDGVATAQVSYSSVPGRSNTRLVHAVVADIPIDRQAGS